MIRPIEERIIKPFSCAIGFGIPIIKSNFHTDVNMKNKDFAKQFNGNWRRYYHEFISNLKKVTPLFEEMGVTVKSQLTLSNYGELLQQKEVVILFSHWYEDKVEFHDGLMPIQEIVRTIPDSFHGIVDLCVCHPTKLSFLIRKEKPNCLVRYIPNKATPYFWLQFYVALFKHLQIKDNTYLTALEEVIAAFLKNKK